MTFCGKFKFSVEENLFLNAKMVVHTNQKYCVIAQGVEEINVCYFENDYVI